MIKRIDYQKTIGTEIKIERVALYDDNNIYEKEVRKYIKSEEYNPNIIHCDREQFESVFKSLIK